MFEGVLDAIGDLSAVALHLLAFALAFGETAMFLDLLVPGELGMALIGAAARDAEVSPVTLAVFGAVGATCGDSVSYALGRAVGTGRLSRPAWLVDRVRSAGEKAEPTFERHGGRAIFFGRFVGVLRAVVPFAAGAGKMPFQRFLVWNVLASVVWVSAVITLGYTLGPPAARQLDRIGGWVSVVALAIVGLVVWRHLRRDRSEDEGEGVREPDDGDRVDGGAATTDDEPADR